MIQQHEDFYFILNSIHFHNSLFWNQITQTLNTEYFVGTKKMGCESELLTNQSSQHVWSKKINPATVNLFSKQQVDAITKAFLSAV